MTELCGIAGIFGNGKIEKKEITRMISKLRHRGPDEREVLWVPPIGWVGHTRLSIIDLKSGKQPISNEDGKITIVFNGEIYNFKKLRKELKLLHNFKTNSDTEVILHLYEDYGEECLKMLDGMFAIIMVGQKDFILARDPLGIKPLYYGKKEEKVYVTSEIKAFPHPMDEIKSLKPGHYLIGGETKLFEDILASSKQIYDLNEEQIKSDLIFILENAVSKRLVADVPIGVFLSGGFDSSLVASIMKKKVKYLHSFTAGMRDAPDLKMALEIANFLKTKHHQLIFNKMEMMKVLPDVIYHLESFDAPIIRSAIPMYFISKVASEYVKVAMSGEGADELFAGYSYLKKFKGHRLRSELNKIIRSLEKTNLQRGDRVAMAFGLEVRVPFLDKKLVKYTLRIPPTLLESGAKRQEKHLLRETFKNYLPASVFKRPKMKFSIGAGSSNQLFEESNKRITDKEFESNKKLSDGSLLRSKEEYYYYKVFKDIFGDTIPLDLIGRTVDQNAGTEKENV